jgi:hypothetical protein
MGNINTVKINIYTLLLGLAIIVPTFNNFELTLAVWALVFSLTLQQFYSKKLLFLAFSLFLIALVGAVFSCIYKNPFYESIRDITYLCKPILGLFIGYQIAKIYKLNIFEILIKIGVVLAIIHFLKLFYGLIFLRIFNIHLLRHVGGYFNDFEVYALVILIFYKKFEIQFSNYIRYIYLTLLTVSCLFYFARINIIEFFILIFALAGYFRPTKKSVSRLFLMILFLLIGYAAVFYSYPNRNAKGFEAFLYKVKNAPIEPFKVKINKTDWKDFNDNYRSYENILTVKQVKATGFHTVIFGKGAGSTIKLGRRIKTNDGEYVTNVPILHNSYMTIYLKSGLIGVFLMFVFLYLILKHNNSSKFEGIALMYQKLLLGTVIFLILSNWVFMGVYFKVDNKIIIIGVLYALIEKYIKNKKTPLPNN